MLHPLLCVFCVCPLCQQRLSILFFLNLYHTPSLQWLCAPPRGCAPHFGNHWLSGKLKVVRPTTAFHHAPLSLFSYELTIYLLETHTFDHVHHFINLTCFQMSNLSTTFYSHWLPLTCRCDHSFHPTDAATLDSFHRSPSSKHTWLSYLTLQFGYLNVGSCGNITRTCCLKFTWNDFGSLNFDVLYFTKKLFINLGVFWMIERSSVWTLLLLNYCGGSSGLDPISGPHVSTGQMYLAQ